jgi:hypothetical protein
MKNRGRGAGLAALAFLLTVTQRIQAAPSPAVPSIPPLDVPYFGQTLAYPWGGDFMGDSRALIADNGCVMVSTCMVLSYYGLDLDPRRLNRALTQAGGYREMSFAGELVGNLSFDFGSIPRIFPEIGSLKMHGPFRSEADFAFIYEALEAGRPVVLLLQSPRGFSHAVVAIGASGKSILINDPLDPATKTLAQGYARKKGSPGWEFEGVVMDAAVYAPKAGKR